jgi:hypothetical protein
MQEDDLAGQDDVNALRMRKLLVEALESMQAPRSQFERLGLP